MKKLVMSALLLGAVSQAAGCIFVSSDDDPVDQTGEILARWDLVDDGDPAACGAANTATVNALRQGQNTPYRDIYNCTDGQGLADDLPLGSYTIWVDFTDSSGNTLFAQSEAAVVNLTSPGQRITADFLVDMANGFFDVSWTLDNGATDCEDVPNLFRTSVLSTLAGTTEGFDDRFDCNAGYAPNFVTTGALPAVSAGSGGPGADYVVVLDLINAQNQSLGSSAVIQDRLSHGNHFEWLGPVDGAPIDIVVD
jgi:hypothetical protein